MRSVVRFEHATLRLGQRTLWHDLDLEVEAGEFLTVLGPNGAGKTSLVRVLLGLQPLSAGSVLVNGRPPQRGSRHIGYIPQQRAIERDLRLPGREFVRLGLDGHRWGWRPYRRAQRQEVQRAIDAVGATAFADAPLGSLSGGEAQRLRTAQALLSDPPLLLCDEPLLSLDLRQQQAVTQLIDQQRRARHTAVILVTHEINPVLPYVDRVLYLVGGRWAVGAAHDILTTATLTDLYGAPVDVLQVRDRIVVVGAPDSLEEPHHLDHADVPARGSV